jgi:hypothetical protein
MARGRNRPERRPGRQERDPVPAILDDINGAWGWPDDEDGPSGSAGVREPRHPKPIGPMSGAGAKPMPETQLVAVLPDPRY